MCETKVSIFHLSNKQEQNPFHNECKRLRPCQIWSLCKGWFYALFILFTIWFIPHSVSSWTHKNPAHIVFTYQLGHMMFLHTRSSCKESSCKKVDPAQKKMRQQFNGGKSNEVTKVWKNKTNCKYHRFYSRPYDGLVLEVYA